MCPIQIQVSTRTFIQVLLGGKQIFKSTTLGSPAIRHCASKCDQATAGLTSEERSKRFMNEFGLFPNS